MEAVSKAVLTSFERRVFSGILPAMEVGGVNTIACGWTAGGGGSGAGLTSGVTGTEVTSGVADAFNGAC